MRIIIGADIIPTEPNFDLFRAGNGRAIVGDRIYDALMAADYRIFNLEGALTNSTEMIVKAGPVICAPTDCIEGYRALNIDLLCMANNHVFDCGKTGFLETLDTVDKAGIARVGAGRTQEEASRGYIFELGGKKIGVMNACEHEFSWVEDYGLGANGFDALYTLDEVVEMKKKCDYLIFIYHGGKEYYRYPSPYLRRVCRKIIEKGADIVLCQHTHCIGSGEDWMGGKIIYGQGNFVFHRPSDFSCWRSGIAVVVDITDEGVRYDYIPYEMNDVGIEMSDDPELIGGFLRRSEEILDEAAMERKFVEMADETINQRYLAHLTDELTDEYLAQHSKFIFHIMECEVHRETINRGLRYRLRLGKWGET